ncbi:hypothetical protein SOVF_028530 isoform B [Spinacia oleracea]|nr:hypothetical protein SOVF_028530 isoform B [Spinacia oleracea]
MTIDMQKNNVLSNVSVASTKEISRYQYRLLQGCKFVALQNFIVGDQNHGLVNTSVIFLLDWPTAQHWLEGLSIKVIISTTSSAFTRSSWIAPAKAH